MDNKPKYLEFSYLQSYTLDLDQLEIDFTNVQSWYIYRHILYVEFVNGPEQKFNLDAYDCNLGMRLTDTKQPWGIQTFDENWEDAELGKYYGDNNENI